MKTLLFLLLATPLLAQEPASVSLRFLSFPRSADETPVELQLGEKTITVELPSNHLSEPVKVPACTNWTFGQTSKSDSGADQFNVWGAGPAKSSANQLVILFRKGPKNSDGFRVISYDTSKKNFGDRQIFFMNLSSQPIAAEVGTIKFALKPAQHRIISPKADMGEDLCHADLLLQRNGKWRPFISTNWPLKPDTRGLIFIYDDPRTSKIRLHTIRDFL